MNTEYLGMGKKESKLCPSSPVYQSLFSLTNTGKYLLIYDSCNGHCIKGSVGSLPDILTVFLPKLLDTLADSKIRRKMLSFQTNSCTLEAIFPPQHVLPNTPPPFVREDFLHGTDLMVASNERELGGHEQLLCQQVGHHFKAMLPSVHIVSKEEEGSWCEDGTHAP